MRSLPASADCPRVGRAVGLQLAALIALAIVAERPWARPRPLEPAVVRPVQKPAEKIEQRLRVVRVPPLPPARPARPVQAAVEPLQLARSEPPPAQELARTEMPPAQRPAPTEPPPAQELARTEPPPKPPAPPQAKPAPDKAFPPPAPVVAPSPRPEAPRKLASAQAAPARQHIAANATAVHGVQLRILVPSDAVDLATHLRNSGGCMVVSRLAEGGAEVVSVLDLASGQAVEQPGPPCAGVPRLLRDGRLNDALGDPIGRARAQLASAERGDELVLQVLLTPQLQDSARLALRSRFGGGTEADVARLAAEAGYQLTCFAKPAGAVRCE